MSDSTVNPELTPKPPAAHTHCHACGDALANELRLVNALRHILCADEQERSRLAYCLWGRNDGQFTTYEASTGQAVER